MDSRAWGGYSLKKGIFYPHALLAKGEKEDTNNKNKMTTEFRVIPLELSSHYFFTQIQDVFS